MFVECDKCKKKMRVLQVLDHYCVRWKLDFLKGISTITCYLHCVFFFLLSSCIKIKEHSNWLCLFADKRTRCYNSWLPIILETKCTHIPTVSVYPLNCYHCNLYRFVWYKSLKSYKSINTDSLNAIEFCGLSLFMPRHCPNWIN